jgi:polyhydroxyalkanoate synthesis regulator phasin
MDDLFKKFINTGVGFLSQGNKAVQVAIEKLVKESKISEQEGKKIVDDLLKNSETKRADLEKPRNPERQGPARRSFRF